MSTAAPSPRIADVLKMLRAFDAAQDLVDQAVAAATGVTVTELRAIELASSSGGVSAGELATRLSLTTGAVTGLVDRMEHAGYLRRAADPKDRRRVIVRLTPKALAWERRMFGGLGRRWAKHLASYSEAELGLITRLLAAGREIAQAHASSLRPSGDRSQHPSV